MRKIVHIISGIGGGGRERRMGQLVLGLLTEDFAEQHIIYFSDSNNKYQEIVNSGAKLHLLKYTNRFDLIIRLLKTLKDISPFIVHVWTEIPIILFTVSLGRFLLNYKLIIGFLADGNSIKSKLALFVAKFSYSCSNAVVSNSFAGLKAKQAPVKKSHVIYNGFDFHRIDGKTFDKDSFIKEYNIDRPYSVCMVARFSPAKDWDMFISLAIQMSKIRSDILFMAVGGGEQLEAYESKIRDNGINNIRFLGQRNDVEKIIEFCDISVLFTNNNVHAEGVSNTIMETMAVGRPVIATKGGGTAEIIENGVNGYIIAPKDIASAIEIIINLLSDTNIYEKISRNAIDTINAKFLLTDKTKEYISLYNSL